MNWRKANACIEKLEERGFVKWLKKGARPRLDLTPVEMRRPMQKHVAALAKKIQRGEQPSNPTGKGAAAIGRDHGWFACDEDGVFSFIAERPLVKAYLSNSLVGDETGKATGEATIIDNIRKARDPMAFRLLVDLYVMQDLAELGGVDRQGFRMQFERQKVTATGRLNIWQFDSGSRTVNWEGRLNHHRREPTDEEEAEGKNAGCDFFRRAEVLEDAGAFEWSYFLAEDGTDTSTLIYPVAVVRHGKHVWDELETLVGNYAVRAACALSDNADSIGIWEGSSYFLLPAERLAREAALVGVPRLRCRAKTSNTARWRKDLAEEAESFIAMFRGIIAENAPELLAEADQRLADFNSASTSISTSISTVIQRDINDSYQSGKNDSSVLRTDANDVGDIFENIFGSKKRQSAGGAW